MSRVRAVAVLGWDALERHAMKSHDLTNGTTNAHSTLRLFGQPQSAVRTVLFRDHHAWCPYCQKIWLWLEEKQVPYQIKKVTMFCYGEKETWYKRLVPSGMLPAVQLDGRIITESDDIMMELESNFGALYKGMRATEVVPLRKLERLLFRAWCQWLCYPASSAAEERSNRETFCQVLTMVDTALASTEGPYFLEQFSTADCVFTPYIERMSASLFYYKGFTLRDSTTFPHVAQWFDAMEERPTYRGTQSDFHTHVHDLPPQMGGCYENGEPQQIKNKAAVDGGTCSTLPDAGFPEPEDSVAYALARIVRHRDNIITANPGSDEAAVDEALRAACTTMVTGEAVQPPPGADEWLRYMRDRVSVPRDMPVWSARRFRAALEQTAALTGDKQGPAIPSKHRRDQNPRDFGKL